MPVSFTRDTVLQIVANQKMGFSFGTPERPDENSLAVVLPILRKTSFQRHYVTLMESDKVDISDTGSINRMRFTNKGEECVFVRSGTMLKGGTQERAITRSAILFPGKTVELDARCVHATRGIQHGAVVKYGGVTPLDFDQRNYTADYRASEQHVFWANAERYSNSTFNMSVERGRSSRPMHSRARAMSPRAASLRGFERFDAAFPVMDSAPLRQDDLASNIDDFARSFADVLAKVTLHENQVGLALISDKACETVELFDVPLSWKAMHEDAVKRVGANVVKPDTSGVFEYKPEKAVAAVTKVLGVGFDQKTLYEHRPSNGEPSVAVIGLSNEKYTGEVVEVDGRVMHLVLLRMVNSNN